MGKARKRVPGRQSDDAPMVTIGDLRARLRSLGNPGQPDPARSDDEPIPQYGGVATHDVPLDAAMLERLRLRSRRAPAEPSPVRDAPAGSAEAGRRKAAGTAPSATARSGRRSR